MPNASRPSTGSQSAIADRDVEPFNLYRAFAGQEQEWLAALDTGRAVAGHHGVQGTGTEERWLTLLERVLPHRYRATPAFIVDSEGRQSQQIDLAIIDRHFSPLLWEWGGHHYVPAESVYAVFEVKPEINRTYLLYSAEKIRSVRELKRTSVSFGWAMGDMPAREPPQILGGFLAAGSGWAQAFGEPFRRALRDAVTGGALDVGCVLGHGSFEISAGSNTDDVLVAPSDRALVTFVLTLLKRLQRMGSATALDYDAYAAWTAS